MDNGLLKMGILFVGVGLVVSRLSGTVASFAGGFAISMGLVFILKYFIENKKDKKNEK